MAWIIAGLFGLVMLLGLLRAFADARPGQVKAAVAWGGGLLGVVLLGLLLVSGRGAGALWSLVLFGPAIWRWWKGMRAARTFARGGRASPGGASDVSTSHLEMGLEHDTGRMFGRVKAGSYAGRDLAELDLAMSMGLLAELAARDPEGVPLLEAWLDRAHPDWREAAVPPPVRSPDGPMTRDDAFAVLGLAPGATEAEIRAAHRRLMQAMHPDHGGSDWLAARLNEARDVLLG